jgi:hypothetical protein
MGDDLAAPQRPVLTYGRRSGRMTRLRKRLIRLFLVVAVIFSTVEGAKGLRSGIAEFRFRLNASRQRDETYRLLMKHTVAEGTVIFDETKHSCAVLCEPASGLTYMVRFRGDPGTTPLQLASWDIWNGDSCLRSLSDADYQAATGSRRLRCLSGIRQLSYLHCGYARVSGPPFSTYAGKGVGLYLHGGRTLQGMERLICVSFDPYQFIAGDTSPVTVCVYSPGKAFRSGQYRVKRSGLGFACGAAEPLRFYAGQPDPVDPSHFTISYTAGKRPGVIDGWLTADGNDVRLVARDQAASTGNAVQAGK